MAGQTPTASASAPRGSAERRPTIRDVAREAGVSHATVSRFLNGGKWVGQSSALAITEAIDITGYRANRFARSLATGRSSTVAFLLTEPQHRLFADQNYPVLLAAVSTALAERDLTPVVLTAGTDEERERVLDFIAGGHVDGVLLVSSHGGDPILEHLVEAGVGVVSCGRPMGWEGRISSVAAEDQSGAQAATEHLVASGCRRIGIITGPLDLGGALDRLEGYYDALDRAGVPRDGALVASGDWTHGSGREATATLLAAAPDLDGLFACNDAMASGAIPVLRSAGRSVPDDVRVVGFDDSGFAATLDPPLSTVRQPFGHIGREMVRILCERSLADGPVVVRLPTRLVLRESSPSLSDSVGT